MRPIGSPAERIEPEHVQERGAYMESLVDKTRHVFAKLLADSGSKLETSGSPPPEAVTYLSDEEPPANEATHYESKARHTASDPGAQDIASDLEGRNIASDPGARDVARDAAAAVEDSMPRTARSAREGYDDPDPELRIVLQEAEAVAVLLSGEEPPILEWSAGEGADDLEMEVPVRLEESIW
jgi:hypothetical protein